MRRLILFLLFFVMIGAVHAQFTYGTTGLLNMPTADMQRDKTFMFGGGAFWRNMPLPPVGPTILSIIILTSLFSPGWKYPIFVHCTRLWRLILHTVRVFGFLPRMGSLLTRTVTLRYVYGCGRKDGGNRGLRKLYWVRMTLLIIHGRRVARLR